MRPGLVAHPHVAAVTGQHRVFAFLTTIGQESQPVLCRVHARTARDDAFHLVIDAQQAPGNLLGNLLCAVTHLLDGTGPLGGLSALLNQILAILQGIGL